MSEDGVKIKGRAVVQVFDKFGNLKSTEEVDNLVTTAGDEYYAKKAMAAISPSAPAAPTAAVHMKLGTGVTAASKSGAGAALGTYIAASNNPFDATYPSAAAVGGDTGWEVAYQTTWAAADVTNAAITEAVIANDATDATTAAAGTYSRITFTAINKTADDALIITWFHKFLGA